MLRFFTAICYCFLITTAVMGQRVPKDELPKLPQPAQAVNDFAGILSAGELQQLEQKLRNFYDSSNSAIVVVTVSSTEPYETADYAISLYENWGVGRGAQDNGVLVLVAPEDRRMWITTGYGLEGAIPDALAKRIVEQIMKPRFRQNNYFAGLDEATTALIGLASGEYSDLPSDKRSTQAPSKGIGTMMVIFFIFFFIVLPMLMAGKRGQNRNLRGRGRKPSLLTTLFLLSQMGGRRGGGWDDFSGGGGMFGGGSGGGGFGGFGGGSTGGGGAGGSW